MVGYPHLIYYKVCDGDGDDDDDNDDNMSLIKPTPLQRYIHLSFFSLNVCKTWFILCYLFNI